MNAMQVYKEYSEADKAALKQLQAEEEKRLNRKVQLSEMIAAVTPGMETPASMQ